ncbi:hypothetical protein IT157_08000 [bacterium]|nr:hypothetical protein [bacterium]
MDEHRNLVNQCARFARHSLTFSWITCVLLWTTTLLAQSVEIVSNAKSLGEIICHATADSSQFAADFKLAADSLRIKRGNLLDLRELQQEEIEDGSTARAIIAGLGEREAPTIFLLTEPPSRTSLIWKRVQERYWWRFESSGNKPKAEKRLKKLVARHEREVRDQMEWMFQKP